ncbi:ADAT3 protein, partial [Acromyrmex insinuator]
MTSPKSVKARKMETATRSWTAKPILSSDFTEAPPLQEVYVGVLKQRKDTSIAIKSISTILPGFAHLKRCSNGKLLLAPLHLDELSHEKGHDISLGENQLKTQLKERGFDLSLLEEKFQMTKVPAKAPRTKIQASEASKIWSVNFHPDQTVESLIDGSIFNDDCLYAIERIMSLVIEAARLEAVGNDRCTGATAIVDPVDGRILAVAAAKIDRHPMWHAAMLAIDLIARLHGGGAWKLNNEECEETKRQTDVIEEDKFGDERTYPNITTEDQISKRLKRIKRRYEEETPLCYPKSLASLKFPVQTSLETQVVRKGRRNNGTKIENSKQKECEDNAKKCGPVARIFYGTAFKRFLSKVEEIPDKKHRSLKRIEEGKGSPPKRQQSFSTTKNKMRCSQGVAMVFEDAFVVFSRFLSLKSRGCALLETHRQRETTGIKKLYNSFFVMF